MVSVCSGREAWHAHQVEAEQQRAEGGDEEDVEEVGRQVAEPRSGVHGVRGAEAGPLVVVWTWDGVVLRLRVSHARATATVPVTGVVVIMTLHVDGKEFITFPRVSRPVTGTKQVAPRRHEGARRRRAPAVAGHGWEMCRRGPCGGLEKAAIRWLAVPRDKR